MASNEQTEYNFYTEFTNYICRIFYIEKNQLISYCNDDIEHFGVLRLYDATAPERKLWHLYYCRHADIDNTIKTIRAKYGKRKVYEIFNEPIYNGIDLCANVRKYFANLKWRTQRYIIEAPPKSHYTDERIKKVVTELYNNERLKMYNYISLKHDWFKKYR